jgi:hypothetical protein
MICSLRARVAVALALGFGTALGRAQDASPAAAPAKASDSPIVSGVGPEKPAAPTVGSATRHHRVISSDVAAQLSAATPKYTPPPPKPTTPPEEEPDMRDLDKPKNGIIRLPKYVVTEKPPPMLTERAVYTKSGLADLAKKRYLTEGYRAFNGFTLPLFGISPEAQAMAMYEEDERLRNMAALTDDARMVSTTDKAAGLYIKRQVDETYMRAPDFDWKPIGR